VSITDEAVYAAAFAVYGSGFDGSIQKEAWLRDFRVALEAAAPIILKDMRQMTDVEKAERDRPESMRRARAELIERGRASTAERIRKAQESAFDDGFTTCAGEHTKQRRDPSYPIHRINPYRAEADG